MLTATLNRFLNCSHGTFGKIIVGKSMFFTLEEEAQGNKPRVSCIPAGTYRCKRTRYNKGGYEVFEVTGVPGRSHVLFHKLNTEEDTEGCIGLGMTIGVLDVRDEDTGLMVPKLAITSSGIAFGVFMASLRGIDEFILVVNDPRI